MHHAFMRITIATTVLHLVRPQVVHLVYLRILIIRRFIPTQDSTSIIVANPVLMIIHGASVMIFLGIVKFPSAHSDLPFTHQFH